MIIAAGLFFLFLDWIILAIKWAKFELVHYFHHTNIVAIMVVALGTALLLSIVILTVAIFHSRNEMQLPPLPPYCPDEEALKKVLPWEGPAVRITPGFFGFLKYGWWPRAFPRDTRDTRVPDALWDLLMHLKLDDGGIPIGTTSVGALGIKVEIRDLMKSELPNTVSHIPFLTPNCMLKISLFDSSKDGWNELWPTGTTE